MFCDSQPDSLLCPTDVAALADLGTITPRTPPSTPEERAFDQLPEQSLLDSKSLSSLLADLLGRGKLPEHSRAASKDIAIPRRALQRKLSEMGSDDISDLAEIRGLREDSNTRHGFSDFCIQNLQKLLLSNIEDSGPRGIIECGLPSTAGQVGAAIVKAEKATIMAMENFMVGNPKMYLQNIGLSVFAEGLRVNDLRVKDADVKS
ncbi:hypothetical protein MBM_06122 [Drepanopeziza brunnea f. sp. 'multigermtubi' MB_m1]|uniref:Uncharacterized protein n=1 Tax=Marssonina brunnea f. sp. multigermtubi (strain MB_m1) TaxID=1072389 RepID=K1XSH7_MARBU|nr:uncharacterized protein MBM_06122 [Drepanopeziza brunnea f. sp. 'multigermtubi' MB_m1]EKD15494.1 hypothetical protein MBM_06122 [Drepanopeziza brunnea f. sp. 'multigermtubi' MB_m1]